MGQLLPAIVGTVRKSRETVAELADVTVEALVSSDVLGNVPVVSVAVKALNVKDAFAQARLRRNCMAFMAAVADADVSSMDALSAKLDSNQDFAEEFADTTMALLLEAQKPVKCEIVGKLIVALARREIDEPEFSKLAEIVQACTVPALRALPDFFRFNDGKPFRSGGEAPQEPLLLSLGVAYRWGTMFRIDASGQNLYRYGFGGMVNENI